MKRQLKPCGDRVLIELVPAEEITQGGIIIPNEIKEAERYATQEAWIVDIGPTAWKMLGDGEPWAKIGDRVLVVKYSGQNREDLEDGKVHRIISDEDILAVFENEGKS